MTDFIVTFKNGGIIDIKTDATYVSGNCPTCEIGAERLNFIKIVTTKYTITIMAHGEYSYVFGEEDAYGNAPNITVSDIITIFDINNPENMTEEDFVGKVVTDTAYLTDNKTFDIRIKANNLEEETNFTYDDVEDYVY